MLVILTYLAYAYIAYCVVRILIRRSWDIHRKAFHKFFVTWAISTSPVFIGFLFTRAEQGRSFSDYFKIDEQFVYAAAFIAPVLYLFYEAIVSAARSEKSEILQEFRDRIKGYERLFFPSLLLLVTTVLAYAGSRLGDGAFRETLFFATFSGQNWLIYLAALLLWYTSILIETRSDQSFSDALKEGTDALKEAAKQRIPGE